MIPLRCTPGVKEPGICPLQQLLAVSVHGLEEVSLGPGTSSCERQVGTLKRGVCGTHSLSYILTRQDQRGDYSAPLTLLEKAVGRMLVGVTGSQVHPWFIQ